MRRFTYLLFLVLWTTGAAAAVQPQASSSTAAPMQYGPYEGDIYWFDEVPAPPPKKAAADTSAKTVKRVENVCHLDPVMLPLPGDHAARDARPMVAIVIDDMGIDRPRSARAAQLPSGVTLAYLPYAAHVRPQAAAAKAAGHELMVHVPMEPERSTADPGPDALLTGLPEGALLSRLAKNLSAFDGYVGINNHMGSKMTQDAVALAPIMAALKTRGLYYLDSKTAPGSVGEKVARDHGVRTTHRNVFLDHFEDAARVSAALRQVEQVAWKEGTAVAIGHPKDVTLEGLEKWLPTLEAKGIRLVPLSRIIDARNATRHVALKDAGAVKP